MAYAILGTPKPAFFDSSGAPLASGTLTVQDPDDSSAKDTYPTAADADASTNGVSTAYTLDSRGEIATQLWGRDGEDYKVILADSAAANVYTIDEIILPLHSRRTSGTITDTTPTISNARLFNAATALTITDFDDGQVGDIITVQATNADNVVSITNSSTISCRDGIDVNLRQHETITFAMFFDQQWDEIGRSENSTRFETVTATNTIKAAESGSTYYLNTAGGFTSTLPAPAVGLKYKFIVKTAPTTAYIVATNGGDNVIYGNLLDIVGELVAVVAQDTVNFVASTSLVGDTAEFESDGTNWYCKLRSAADGGITVAAT